MDAKKILLLLITLLIYINVYSPLTEKNNTLKEKIIATKRSILKDKLYLKNQHKLLHDLNRSEESYNIYLNKHLYTSQKSQIFNLMQKKIKEEILKCNIHESNIKWGESYKTEGFIEFPMSVRVYGAVKNLGKFIETIRKNPKLHIKAFSISNSRKYYMLHLTIFAVSRSKDV